MCLNLRLRGVGSAGRGGQHPDSGLGPPQLPGPAPAPGPRPSSRAPPFLSARLAAQTGLPSRLLFPSAAELERTFPLKAQKEVAWDSEPSLCCLLPPPDVGTNQSEALVMLSPGVLLMC